MLACQEDTTGKRKKLLESCSLDMSFLSPSLPGNQDVARIYFAITLFMCGEMRLDPDVEAIAIGRDFGICIQYLNDFMGEITQPAIDDTVVQFDNGDVLDSRFPPKEQASFECLSRLAFYAGNFSEVSCCV
jgi:hypothetical protein